MKQICMASCPDTGGLESLEHLLNNFFYSENWTATEDKDGLKVLNTKTGKQYPDEKIEIQHKAGRYGIYRRGK